MAPKQSPVVLPPLPPRSSSPQSRAALEHSGGTSRSTWLFPKHLRHRLPRVPCRRAQPGALLSLQPPKLCPPQDAIPLQITGCCLQFPFLSIKTALVTLESSLWEHLCVCFSYPPPRASNSGSQEAASKLLFTFVNGLLGLLLPLILASRVQLECPWIPALWRTWAGAQGTARPIENKHFSGPLLGQLWSSPPLPLSPPPPWTCSSLPRWQVHRMILLALVGCLSRGVLYRH